MRTSVRPKLRFGSFIVSVTKGTASSTLTTCLPNFDINTARLGVSGVPATGTIVAPASGVILRSASNSPTVEACVRIGTAGAPYKLSVTGVARSIVSFSPSVGSRMTFEDWASVRLSSGYTAMPAFSAMSRGLSCGVMTRVCVAPSRISTGRARKIWTRKLSPSINVCAIGSTTSPSCNCTPAFCKNSSTVRARVGISVAWPLSYSVTTRLSVGPTVWPLATTSPPEKKQKLKITKNKLRANPCLCANDDM